MSPHDLLPSERAGYESEADRLTTALIAAETERDEARLQAEGAAICDQKHLEEAAERIRALMAEAETFQEGHQHALKCLDAVTAELMETKRSLASTRNHLRVIEGENDDMDLKYQGAWTDMRHALQQVDAYWTARWDSCDLALSDLVKAALKKAAGEQP